MQASGICNGHADVRTASRGGFGRKSASRGGKNAESIDVEGKFNC